MYVWQFQSIAKNNTLGTLIRNDLFPIVYDSMFHNPHVLWNISGEKKNKTLIEIYIQN